MNKKQLLLSLMEEGKSTWDTEDVLLRMIDWTPDCGYTLEEIENLSASILLNQLGELPWEEVY